VIEESGQALKMMEALCDRPLFMSINIASRQIEEPTFTKVLIEKIRLLDIDHHQIKLEILERSLFDSDLAKQWTQEVRQQGFLLSLDDFGTGFSSLQYLNNYHLDSIKIDKSFVDGLENKANQSNQSRSVSLCAAMINLAIALGMTVIAEGIESAEQAAALKAMGCDLGQGYYYARPMPLEDALQLLTTPQTFPIVPV
jgi:EAL domain-containing protein (putative c-di-GMP-specific phosphodiesterase class I)